MVVVTVAIEMSNFIRRRRLASVFVESCDEIANVRLSPIRQSQNMLVNICNVLQGQGQLCQNFKK